MRTVLTNPKSGQPSFRGEEENKQFAFVHLSFWLFVKHYSEKYFEGLVC